MEKRDGIAVSVIVPVYNVEKYLNECLRSIVNQTLQNIEIIILIDGSLDNSATICDEYYRRDNRICIYSHENIGLGETRNRGVEIAKGEYIFFADSDDYLSVDYIESLYLKAKETGADIIQGESKMFFDDQDEEILEVDLSELEDVNLDKSYSVDFFKNLFFTHIYKHYAWNKLYRTSFVIDNNIRFGDNKKIFAEDTWFQLQTFHYNPRISFSCGSYYFYRQHSTSIMHTPKKNLLKRQGKMIEDYRAFLLKNNGSNLEYKICGMIAMDVFTMEALNQIAVGGKFKDYKKAIGDIRKNKPIYKCICEFNRNKAGILEKNTFRRKYIKLVSFLYELRLDYLAQLVVWGTYKLIR